MLETITKTIIAAIDWKQWGMAIVPIAILLYQNYYHKQNEKENRIDLKELVVLYQELVRIYHSDLKDNMATSAKLEQTIQLLAERLR
jgi:hypothetical protein